MPTSATTSGSIHASNDSLAPSLLQERLPPLLSVIAGMVDLTGFFTLGNLHGSCNRQSCVGGSGSRARRSAECGPSFGNSCLHPRTRRRVAGRPDVRPARSGPGATPSPDSISAACWSFDFQHHHQTIREPARLDGRHRRDACRVRDGLSVRPFAVGHTGCDFNCRDDRQPDQHRPVADGSNVAEPPADDERCGAVETIPASPPWFSGGLRGSRSRHLFAWRLGLVIAARAGRSGGGVVFQPLSSCHAPVRPSRDFLERVRARGAYRPSRNGQRQRSVRRCQGLAPTQHDVAPGCVAIELLAQVDHRSRSEKDAECRADGAGVSAAAKLYLYPFVSRRQNAARQP
jgi:hypothetical protein